MSLFKKNGNGANFLDDAEKMHDFLRLDKEEFLRSYSYITEQEYNNTMRLYGKTRYGLESRAVRYHGIVEPPEASAGPHRQWLSIAEKEPGKSNLHYYELCFFHDEDDSLAGKGRCSYCIKTEIPPVISEDVALQILFGEQPTEQQRELMKNLTCIQEISECEALESFDMDELNVRVEDVGGVYYKRN